MPPERPRPSTGDLGDPDDGPVLLGRYWDALGAGQPATDGPAASDLAGTVLALRRLGDVGSTSNPDPVFRTRLRAHLLANHPASRVAISGIDGVPPARTIARSAGSVHGPARGRRWPVVDVLAVAALLLLIVGGAVVGGRLQPGEDRSRPAGATPTGGESGRLVHPLYLVAAGGAQGLVPIDPLVLADRPDGQIIFLAPLNVVVLAWTLSADGSTLALLQEDGDDAAEIVVRDALSGAERVRIAPRAGSVALPIKLALSRDGSRLVVGSFSRTADAPSPVLEWRTFDARTGDRISTARPRVTNEQFTNGPFPGWLASDWAVVDPAAQRLFQVVPGSGTPALATPNAAPALPASRLLVFDLTTGAQIDAVDLPGIWFEPESFSTPPRGQSTVRLAVSADGGRVAIPHPDGGALSLIDTERLRVERKIALLPPDDDLATPTAEVAASNGTLLAAAFSPDLHPDAQRLHVSGFRDGRSLGLLVVDVRTGSVVARALTDRLVLQVEPASNGATVYVIHRDPAGIGDVVLGRLDAFTLAVVTERQFPWYELPSIVFQPAAPPLSAPDAPGEGDLEIRLHLCPAGFEGALETARGACRYLTPEEIEELGLFVTRTGEPVSTIAGPDAEGVVLFHGRIGDLTVLLDESPTWTVLADCHDASGRPVATRAIMGGMEVAVTEDSPVLCDWYLIPPAARDATPTSA